MKLRIFDYLSIVISLVVIAFVSVSVYGKNEKAQTVTIDASGKSYVYMLDTDRVIDVPGPLGITVVKIENSAVFVTDSACKDKLCILAPPLKKAGEWNACMPNKVFIRISGKKDNEPDSLSY